MTQLPQPAHLLLRKRDLIYYYREEVTEECENFATMDWINCNLCCRQPGDEKERTFTLSSCGHIFCDLCLARVESREKCAVCSSTCQLMQLSAKMKPDAEVFFQEPATLVKKHFTLLTRLLDFQKDHRIRLVSFHRKTVQKYKDLEKQMAARKMQEEERYNAAKARIQELECEVQKLRSFISSKEYSEGGAGSTGIPRKVSPKMSPGGTIISPGRITMVKKNQGLGGGSRGIPNISPTASYGSQLSSTPNRGKVFSPVSSQYLMPQPQHPRHAESLQHPMPGMSHFRNISPVIPGKSSPASRILPGPPSLTSSHGHLSTPGFHPFMPPPQPQLRPHTPLSFTSPNSYSRQPHDLPAYKKY